MLTQAQPSHFSQTVKDFKKITQNGHFEFQWCPQNDLTHISEYSHFWAVLDLLCLFFCSDGLNFCWRDLKVGAYESPPPYSHFDLQHAHTLGKLSQIVPKSTVFDPFLHVFGFGGLIFSLRDLKIVACESPCPGGRFDVRHAHTLTKSHFGPLGPRAPQ